MQISGNPISPGGRKIIEATRALLADPRSHTTGAVARDKYGVEVGSKDVRAVCWCFIGGLSKASEVVAPLDPFDSMEALARVERTIERLTDHGTHRLLSVNEEGVVIPGPNGEPLTGHAAVLRVLDVALEA